MILVAVVSLAPAQASAQSATTGPADANRRTVLITGSNRGLGLEFVRQTRAAKGHQANRQRGIA